jgi:hypothetical protein
MELLPTAGDGTAARELLEPALREAAEAAGTFEDPAELELFAATLLPGRSSA